VDWWGGFQLQFFSIEVHKVRRYWHIVRINMHKVCTRIALDPTKHN
jgi:hypothetical protein